MVFTLIVVRTKLVSTSTMENNNKNKKVFRNDKGDLQESSQADTPALHLLGHLLQQRA